MEKKTNVEINIYGGVIQVLPDVTSMEQNIYHKDGKMVVKNIFKKGGK